MTWLVGFYFAALLLSALIVISILLGSFRQGRCNAEVVFFVAVSLVALFITWREIILFTKEQLHAVGGDWNKATVFVHAYEQVTDSPGGFFWSSQLLSFVVPGQVVVSYHNRLVMHHGGCSLLDETSSAMACHWHRDPLPLRRESSQGHSAPLGLCCCGLPWGHQPFLGTAIQSYSLRCGRGGPRDTGSLAHATGVLWPRHAWCGGTPLLRDFQSSAFRGFSLHPALHLTGTMFSSFFQRSVSASFPFYLHVYLSDCKCDIALLHPACCLWLPLLDEL